MDDSSSSQEGSIELGHQRCLIAGLGNPGKKYERTRHNVGFDVLRGLAERFPGSRPRARFDGEMIETAIAGIPVILLSPTTYMNHSGRSVRAAVDFYKLDLQSLLVVCDDFQLPLAKLRFRPKGSAGGQKGLQDCIRQLGTSDFPRLRIGIGTPPPQWDVADFVLSRFSGEDVDEIETAYNSALNGIERWVRSGIQAAMNEFNVNR